MEYARSAGFPVPRVFEISDEGTDVVMERIEGGSMLADLESRPWGLKRHAATLAELHGRLHEIPAPEWLAAAPGGEGDRLLHLDLHPLNVMLAPGGPVVIDWTNAARGQPQADVAATWILMATGAIPGGRLKAAVLGRFRSLLVNSYLGHFDLAPVRAELPALVEWKCHDANMSETEKALMRELAHRHGRA